MTGWLLTRLWRGSGAWQWLLAAVLVATVGLATLVVLFLSSIPAALDRQESRIAWTQPPDWMDQADPHQDPDHVYLRDTRDRVGEAPVTIVNVAVVGDGVPAPPGVGAFPGPGEVLLSPALADRLQATGDADRYGRVVGTIGARALAGPEALMALRGTLPDQLAPVAPPALRLRDAPGSQPDPVLALVLALAGAAMLGPPLLLAYLSTRAASRSRQRQSAALVIAGAPRRLLVRLAAAEAGVGAVLGTALGAGAFLLLRGVLAPLVVEPPAPFPADLVPAWPVLLLTAIALPLAVVLIAVRAARRAVRDPLAATVTAREPAGTWRWAVVGVLVLMVAAAAGLSGMLPRSQTVVLAVLAGAVSLLLVAPALCRGLGSALLRSSRAAAVLAGGSLTAAPRAAARLVSTAVLAVFVAATFVVAFPAAVDAAYREQPVIEQSAQVVSVELPATASQDVQRLAGDLRRLDGVDAVATVLIGTVQTGSQALTVWLGDCSAVVAAADMDPASCSADHPVTLSSTAASGLADAGAEISGLATREVTPFLEPDLDAPWALPLPPGRTQALQTSPAAVDRPQIMVDVGSAGLDTSAFRPTLITVRVGDPRVVEEIGRLALATDPSADVRTRESAQAGFDGGLRRYYSLMVWGAGLTMLTAAVAVFTGALATNIERARTTSVLWAVGARVRTLRRASLLSIVAPLVVLSALAGVLGLLSGLLIVPGTAPVWSALLGLWPVLAGLAVTVVAGVAASWSVRATTATTQIRHE